MRTLEKQECPYILFILAVPLFPLKGASFTCFRQALVARKRGFRVTILCPKILHKYGKKSFSDSDLNDIRVLDEMPPKTGSNFMGHIRTLLFSWISILRTIRREDPSLLHVHNPPDIIPMTVSLIHFFFKIPLIYEINDPGPESVLSLTGLFSLKKLVMLQSARWMECLALRRSSGLVTINQVIKKRMRESRRHISHKPFVVQYSSPILDRMSPHEKDIADDNFIIYVGTLSTELLGLEPLIRLFLAVWRKYQTKLFILGDGPLRGCLESVVKKISAEDYIHIPGYIEPSEVMAYLEKAKLCVIPYLDTPLTRLATPTKLFEYMAMGKAIVFPDLPGLVEVLGSRNPGMYQISIPGDIIRVMVNLLGDEGLRAQIEVENRQASKNFDPEQEIHKIIQLYERVLASREKK
jgi:glycosyltransferase involved in cell wall biosynthesis